MVKIKPDEINLLSKYIYDISGINIDNTKAYLLETRLGKLLETDSCTTYKDLYYAAKKDFSKKLEKKIIDAITTNETLFFRDSSPFELLKYKIVPEIIDAHSNPNSQAVTSSIRIWSAACSTGQELYSIAITLKELLFDVYKYRINLLGTDISNAAVAQACAGVYKKFEIERGLPPDKLKKYFSPNGVGWKIKEEIRKMATFKTLNLLEQFNYIGKFDIIFCRNVAIYFTLEDRKKLFNRIAEVLEPDGFLIIGSTESLTGVCPRFVPKRHLKSIFYQLK
jgi:chemotaxis protein methyltransferase CheR